jgi:hypothetical protein
MVPMILIRNPGIMRERSISAFRGRYKHHSRNCCWHLGGRNAYWTRLRLNDLSARRARRMPQQSAENRPSINKAWRRLCDCQAPIFGRHSPTPRIIIFYHDRMWIYSAVSNHCSLWNQAFRPLICREDKYNTSDPKTVPVCSQCMNV